MTRPTFSFEFFPKDEKLWEALPLLAALKPKFMTVTYGSDGATKEKTADTVEKIMRLTDVLTAAHLTFINSTKQELKAYIDGLWQKGVRHIIALRGDMPAGLKWPLDADGDYFQYTSDFVQAIKQWYPEMEISVGAYPEKHPDAPSLQADIIALKKKCDAGADRAITQFFFDNENYYRFVEKCAASGIATSIIPGLLPIHDFTGMCNFAARCKANVPQDLREKFETSEDTAKLAIELLTAQVQDLLDNGVRHVHFYTLNKADITADVVKAVF